MEYIFPKLSREQLPARIEKHAIMELPLIRYTGAVSLVTTQEELFASVEHLSGETILGFDTETKPSFRRGQAHPVSLLQFATHNHVYLFQLQKLRDLSPLNVLLSNPSIAKAGVALHDDVRLLNELHAFDPVGFVEISSITRTWGIENTGLRSLTALLLGHRISKSMQVSNWANPTLTEAQIIYAATDAWVARCLYQRIQELH
jgi:ribonuclease D